MVSLLLACEVAMAVDHSRPPATVALSCLCALSIACPATARGDPLHASDGPMTGVLGLPMAREGSGTSWQPDASPMPATQWQIGGWSLMLHGSVFVDYDAQGSVRGDSQVDSINWLMLMARHPLGAGEISGRVMLSAEALTVGGAGYPLLLQTGETWHGAPLHDHQHPHDLFMETAVEYAVPVSDALAAQLYVAPAGEPALGPVAFPHRTSARSDPMAPLGHHWEDSTHISYGVVTAGVFTRTWKLEGSWFNGREPDENRYDFDLRVPDSFSGRLSVNPAHAWSAQVSYGYLASPEASLPEESVHRVTASVALDVPLLEEGHLASLALFGVDLPSDSKATPAWLLESNADLTRHHTVFGRIEILEKTGADLVLPPALADQRFAMGAFTLGYEVRFLSWADMVAAVGASGTLDVVGPDLEPFYGTRTPLGAVVFFQVRPEDMRMEAAAQPTPAGPTAPMPGMPMP